MVIPSTGGEARELVRLQQGGEEGSVSGLEWARDGRYLLLSIGDSEGSFPVAPELWRIPVAGGKRERVGLPTQGWATVAMHPDGRQIAFTAGEPKQEVWVMENFLAPLKAAR